MNILHVTSEVSPYSKTGGLADVLSALPKAQRLQGHSVSVLSPLYPTARSQAGPLSRPVSPMALRVGTTRRSAEVYRYTGHDGVRQMFLHIPDLYDRPGVYGEGGRDYPDNPLRFALLAKAAVIINLAYDMGFDVIHCHDWQTALTPLYRATTKDSDKRLAELSVVYTIHNLAYQGAVDTELAPKLGIPKKYRTTHGGLEFYGSLNMMKAGILLADLITTVSPTYAEEICTEALGAGLHGVLSKRGDDLVGILNGVDYSVWSPECDPHIPYRFTQDGLNGKRRCKAALQTHFGLAIRPHIPLVGMVTRLVEQKGVDLVAEAARPLLEAGKVQLAVVGQGEPSIEADLQALARAYPKNAGVAIGYFDDLAHLIFAGADLFAMPSRFEPCGLAQLYAMRYGALPVVRDTGGLHDTVQDHDPETGEGTGFRFSEATSPALARALERGIEAYHRPRRWRQLTVSAMQTDFSWRRAAERYDEVYQRALERTRD